MRVAPVGLWHHQEPAALVEAAEASAVVTHAHPLGIEGAILLARATAMALKGPLDLRSLRDGARAPEFRDRIETAEQDLTRAQVVARLGNSTLAHESTVTALYAARRFREFLPMIDFVVSLRGDTDTIGAMAGALFGAAHGVGALPADLLDRLEERAAIERTARDLHAAWRHARNRRATREA
jgi:ADP-ribosylglycohydrolase